MGKSIALIVILPTILVALIFAIVDLFQIPNIAHPDKWWLLLFFAGAAFVSARVSHMGVIHSEPSIRIGSYFASMFLRLILSLGLVVYYLLKHQEAIKIFILNFFVMYFLYMAFEIYFLLAILRADSRQRQ